ncbi:phage holin [Romboutsia sp.]|uniref:phage holin n=1 Tax=Romboutsia sp. TaxID=1965302 RepID=UPI003F33136F
MDNNIFNLLLVIITLTITTVGSFLINLIKQKIGSDKTKTYYELAKQVVMSIEQFNPLLSGVDKKALAISKLVELTNNKITAQQADILIESAVYEIKKIFK